MKIKVKNSIGERLDKFLTDELKDQNRSQIKKMIDRGEIYVNGAEGKGSYKVKDGDIIERNKISQEDRKKEEKVTSKKDESLFRKIKVVTETDDYLVVNKPAGLIVHGADHITETNLADWLLEKYPNIKGVGEEMERPGIVHRLDKEASGLMVVARNQKAYNSLKKQFQKRTVEKKYRALVFGQVGKDEDKIDFPIKRSSSGNKQAAIPKKEALDFEEARDALTLFEIEQSYINYTLLDVKIKTGRKHQIRVHLHAYGHPIVGDGLYYTKKTKELNEKLGLGRIFLCAYYLAFTDLSGDKQEFKVSLPKELKDFLKTIK